MQASLLNAKVFAVFTPQVATSRHRSVSVWDFFPQKMGLVMQMQAWNLHKEGEQKSTEDGQFKRCMTRRRGWDTWAQKQKTDERAFHPLFCLRLCWVDNWKWITWRKQRPVNYFERLLFVLLLIAASFFHMEAKLLCGFIRYGEMYSSVWGHYLK